MTTYPAGAICVSPEVGTLTINSVSLNTPAWACLDLSPLWSTGPTLRGSNAVIPATNGRLALPRWVDEMTVDLPFAVTGVCNSSGTPYSDDEKGLQANLRYLLANVVQPPTPPIATRAASLLLPDGTTTLTAAVQVVGFDPVAHGTKRRGLTVGVLTLTIPSGGFA